MSESRSGGAARRLVVGLVLVTACRASAPDQARSSRDGAAADSTVGSGAQQAPPAAVPHGDHNPHHGGVVLMKGDLHYEVVVDRSGRVHHLYFSDAIRDDLPASLASSASLTIRRPDEPEERIPLQIDDAGESWVGSGRSVLDPARTAVRVMFTVANDPYWIDVPLGDAQGR